MALLFASCAKEETFATTGVTLDFSCDTMAFDTVFTQMGSTTRQLKVYNHSRENVRIGEVTLAEGYASRFRLNVDGDTSMTARNIDIAAGDSIFIFVRANIKPNLATEPFLIEDAILFRMDDGTQRLPLTAYGRNAVYHVPTDTIMDGDTAVLDMYGKPYAYSVIDCDNWRHDLPHIIVGYALVYSDDCLHLLPGDELYFAQDAVLWIYDRGSLDARGSEEQPVLFTSLRHDGWYDYLPGQWGHIWMMQGCIDNVIDHAVVENAFIGLEIDSCSNANPTLRISNCEVRNCEYAGIWGKTARIDGNNLLVTNCGTATVAMWYGGDYRFSGCTFADYWRYSNRIQPSVLACNYYDYLPTSTRYLWDFQAELTDCIIYGSRNEELYVGIDDRARAVMTINHCLIRGGEWDEDPLFVDPKAGDYHLQEDSPALGIGYQFPASETPEEKHGLPGHLPTAHPASCANHLIQNHKITIPTRH